jgi:hypothetical protein
VPQKRDEQPKGTPARPNQSTSVNDSEKSAFSDCLDKLRRAVEDARNLQFKLAHVPSDKAVVLWAEFPEKHTQWLRECGYAIKDYGARLHDHRPDGAWVRSEIERNWSSLEAQLEKWKGIICEILRLAGTRAGAGQEEAERAHLTDEMEHAVRAARAEHIREFSTAKQVALGADELPQKREDMSRYFDAARLTDKQREVASLSWEYGLPVAQIARRLGKHRKTVDELLAAAKTKIDQAGVNEKRAKQSAATSPQD